MLLLNRIGRSYEFCCYIQLYGVLCICIIEEIRHLTVIRFWAHSLVWTVGLLQVLATHTG